MGLTLRDYQQELKGLVYQRIREGKKRVVVFGPTGMGKTPLAASIVEDALSKGCYVLLVARQTPLIPQTIEDFESWGIKCGAIKSGMKENREVPVQVASVGSLVRRKKPEAELVLIDECHDACSPTYGKVFEAYPDAIIIGFTATPYRLSKRQSLADRFECIVGTVQTQDLMDQGWLTPYQHKGYNLDVSGVGSSNGDYKRDQLSVLCNTPRMVDAALKEYQKYGRGKRVVSFAVNRAHARNVADRGNELGIPFAYIDANTKNREEIFDDLANGRILGLSSIDVISEGFNVPAVEVGLMLRRTRSRGKYVQQGGRLLRPSPKTGKERAILIDQAGNCHEPGFGFLSDRIEIALNPAKKGPIGETPLKTCTSCNTLMNISVMRCPDCGHIFPRVEKRKEIFTPMTDMQVAKKYQRLHQLVAVQRLNGFKPIWVFFRMRKQFSLDMSDWESIAKAAGISMGKIAWADKKAREDENPPQKINWGTETKSIFDAEWV